MMCPAHAQPDLLAGMSVAALVVPQSMSYARLAGLPSIIGLYGAFVPVLCYAALGSSRHLVRSPPEPYPKPGGPAVHHRPVRRVRAGAVLRRAGQLAAPGALLRPRPKPYT